MLKLSKIGPGRFEDDLRRVLLFQDLEDRHLRHLSQRFIEFDVPSHAMVVRDGEPATSFYVIRRGSVAVFRQAVGKPVQLLARLRSGEFFGELGIFGAGRRHMASVRASEPSRILRISRKDLLDFFGDQPKIERALRLTAAQRHLANVTSLLDLGRRREVRIHLEQPCQVEAAEGSVRTVMLENLSLGGLCLTGVPEDWQEGRAVSFGLGLREGLLQLSCRVVWRSEQTVGLMFEKISGDHDTNIQMAIQDALEMKKYADMPDGGLAAGAAPRGAAKPRS